MIDLSEHEANPPASDESLEALADYVGKPLPMHYVELLKASNGLFAGERFSLYTAEDLPEESDNYDVKAQAPGYLLIGDDSDSNAILLELGDDDPPVFMVEQSSMDPDEMEPVAEELSSWIEAGFPLPDAEEDAEEDDDEMGGAGEDYEDDDWD